MQLKVVKTHTPNVTRVIDPEGSVVATMLGANSLRDAHLFAGAGDLLEAAKARLVLAPDSVKRLIRAVKACEVRVPSAKEQAALNATAAEMLAVLEVLSPLLNAGGASLTAEEWDPILARMDDVIVKARGGAQ